MPLHLPLHSRASVLTFTKINTTRCPVLPVCKGTTISSTLVLLGVLEYIVHHFVRVYLQRITGFKAVSEACAQTQDIYGQAIIAATREGRNLTRLDDQGMGNSMFAPAQTRVTQKASLGTSTYTVEEAKNNIK